MSNYAAQLGVELLSHTSVNASILLGDLSQQASK